MVSIASIGEVMIELTPIEAEPNKTQACTGADKKLSYAGDTYNTAITLARLGVQSDFVTLLGADHFSDNIIETLNSESVGTSGISRLQKRTVGVYMVHNSSNGERAFYYWRDDSAARQLFSSDACSTEIFEHLKTKDYLYFSGITLAILSPAARKRFFNCIRKLKEHGVKIAFDSNYRPALWQNQAEAQLAIRSALKLSDIALLTLDDEAALWSDKMSIALDAAKYRYRNDGISEIIFKCGAENVIAVTSTQTQEFRVPKVSNVVDTTAAGDTFNAGYLAGRLQGATIRESVAQACRCAGTIIQHRGGIIAKEVFNEAISCPLGAAYG